MYLDCTLGIGGHLETMVKNIPSLKKAIGIERDERNLELAKLRLKSTLNKSELEKVVFVHNSFAEISLIAQQAHVDRHITSMLYDLGISSVHIDDSSRGFSLNKEGPLDMRFDNMQSLRASDILATYSEDALTELFKVYGEEPHGRKLARAIVHDRKTKPFLKTTEFRDFIGRILGSSPGNNPANRIFQALRIEVNQELEHIEISLNGAIEQLAPGGKLAVMSFHSLEDRIVKNIFRNAAKTCVCKKEILRCICRNKPLVKLLTKKPISPSSQEIQKNSRARSAKLRVVERLS